MGVGIERVTSKGSQLESRRPEARPGWAAQTALLTRRSLLNVFRNYGQNVGFLFQALMCAPPLLALEGKAADGFAELESRWDWRSTSLPRRQVGSKPSRRSCINRREFLRNLVVRIVAKDSLQTSVLLPLYHRVRLYPDHRAHRFRSRTRGQPLRHDPLRSWFIPLVPPWKRRLSNDLRTPYLLHVRGRQPFTCRDVVLTTRSRCGFTTENLAINLLSFIAQVRSLAHSSLAMLTRFVQCIMQQLAACSYALLACSINRSFASASLLANGADLFFSF